MNLQAELKVVLMANDVVVAEFLDSALWQNVLATTTTRAGTPTEGILVSGSSQHRPTPTNSTEMSSDGQQKVNPLAKFAMELSISETILVGACDPSPVPPYINMDKHHWEAVAKVTPPRGAKAVTPFRVAVALLVLWKEILKLDAPTTREINCVLETIGLKERESTRRVRTCSWLRLKGNRIILNPAESSTAVSLARAYCTKTAPQSP